MPGISDRRALINAVIDSLVIPKSTEIRLESRNVYDTKSAVRLRRVERDLLKEWEPKVYPRISEEAKRCLVEKLSGNHYYYKFGLFILGLLRDKSFIMGCRSKAIMHQAQLSFKLLEVKIPDKEFKMAVTSFPYGYQRVHNLYIALRSLYDQLMSMYSACGKHRGKLQSINTKYKNDRDFEAKFAEWKLRERELLDKEGRSSDYSCSYSIDREQLALMLRVSDITYLEVENSYERTRLLLTPNHFERCLSFIKQVSNILMGSLLAYGMEGNYEAEEIVNDIIIHMKKMFKIGITDDLGVGEAGKAVTDLLKAKLSQTDELPWNNFSMLMNTYSEKRQTNAEKLWDEYGSLKHDPDILLNMSYVWKTAAQPDSSIRDDFVELIDGLGKPNPITDEAPGIIEVAIRRAVLVGAIRENRQVSLKAEDGVTISKELQDAVSRSFPSERDLRLVTHGMLKGVQIQVPNVFPSPFDVSHLMFKDKSSAVDAISVRKSIIERSEAEEEIISMEDESILENAHLAADAFLEAVKVNPTKEGVSWSIKATANDILTSLDEKMSEVFNLAERKFRLIAKTMSSIRSKYGGPEFTRDLLQWAKENPEALINTATEPKYGEVHKRSVRIFYMFEKGMKTFLSQFERIARVVGYYIKGAEIVKGDRAREHHMNILSSAHRAEKEGVLAYQILFDLSKFSQKFNHRIIDAATKVIGELVGYPEYSQISDLFKASFLFVSSRNTDKAFVGVLGAFEGFLNFLWTNIHATVMDIALRNCGRSGDLAAYSDDGLLMFTMNAKPTDPHSVIRKELSGIISSIRNTYADFGLDFNLGKTLISRTLAEFLGIVQYKGHRFPTWMKELCHLGVPDEIPLIRSMGQEITDIASQMAATIKAGMPAFAATFVGYLEIFMGPGRRLVQLASEARGSLPMMSKNHIEIKAIILLLCLNQSFGGIRVPDPLTSMMTADFDPTSEMLYDLHSYLRVFPDVGGIASYLLDKISPTEDYTSLLLGASPVHTSGVKYSTGTVKSKISQEVRRKLDIAADHPLSRKKAPKLHQCLETISNIYLPSITSLTRYIVNSIVYEKTLAPTRASSVARLLKKGKIRVIQKFDSSSLKDQLKELMVIICSTDNRELPSTDTLYRISFPKLDFAPSLPSSRALADFTVDITPVSYEITINKMSKLDDKGSTRLLNQGYFDDLVPPLVTTDVTIQHLMNAPDLVSHCMRGIYSELISSSSQGHDLSSVVDAICELNGCPLIFPQLITPLMDMRKIAVANRKKSIHRVYWSEPVKSAVTLTRMGQLNHYMTSVSNFHYSLIVTSILARITFILTGSDTAKRRGYFFYKVPKELLERTRLLPMTQRSAPPPIDSIQSFEGTLPPAIVGAIKNEVVRTVDSTKQELVDNLLIGRMGMLPDFQQVNSNETVLDPLRYAVVWSLIKKLDSMADGSDSATGITAAKIRNSPLENIPIDLVNLAVIYRSYKNVRKSTLGVLVKDFMKRSESSNYESPLPINVADETLMAASQLGLVTSLDRKSLRSVESALSYNSMLIATGISMIYYSLDSKTETHSAEKMSHSRVGAMRRITDSLITQLFQVEDYNFHTDAMKLILMIIKGSMRGSVHRSLPFNIRVAKRWAYNFTRAIQIFYGRQHVSLRTPLAGEPLDHYRTPGLSDELSHKLETYLRNSGDGSDRPDLGTPDQYDQFIKFTLKLAKWGFLYTLFSRERMSEQGGYWLQEQIYSTYDIMVKPAIMMARTVSYNTVSKVIENQCIPATEQFEMQKSIEVGIATLMEGVTEGPTYHTFLSSKPNEDYRSNPGPLAPLKIRLNFPIHSPLTLHSSLPYALSLPLLFAAGRTSLSSISLLGSGNSALQNDIITRALSEVSLPVDPDGIPLGIISGFSEVDIWAILSRWKEENQGASLVAVEIPPDATLFSLGIIGFLASQNYSYATVGISSDLEGASIYIVSVLEENLPRIPSDKSTPNQHIVSLGDGALYQHIFSVSRNNLDFLSALYLSPLHQAGIPIYSHLEYGNTIVSLRVEEELLDRHRVSFVETVKSSKTAQIYAALDTERAAYLIRAHRMKIADNEAFVNIAASFLYYLKALDPKLDLEILSNFIVELFNNRVDESEQNHLLRHLAAPIVSMKEINPSSLPSAAQMKEIELLDLDLDGLEAFTGTCTISEYLLKQSATDILKQEEKGLLIAYIQDNPLNPDPERAWIILESVREDPNKRVRHKGKVQTARKIFVPSVMAEDQLRKEAGKREALEFRSRADIIQTQSLFRVSFGEDVFDDRDDREETPDELRARIRNELVSEGIDEFSLAVFPKVTDEELKTLSANGLVDLEIRLMELVEEDRAEKAVFMGVSTNFGY